MSTTRFLKLRYDGRDSLARLDTETYLARADRLWQMYGRLDHCLFPFCLDDSGGYIGPEGMQVDHIIPWIGGGCDHDHNLRVAHTFCNTTKADYVSEIQFHCPTCQFDALRCWNDYAVRQGRIRTLNAWRRRHGFNKQVKRPVYVEHSGQDLLW